MSEPVWKTNGMAGHVWMEDSRSGPYYRCGRSCSLVGSEMKRLLGWVILCARLHSSLRAARVAIGQVGRGPILTSPSNLRTADLHAQRGFSKEAS